MAFGKKEETVFSYLERVRLIHVGVNRLHLGSLTSQRCLPTGYPTKLVAFVTALMGVVQQNFAQEKWPRSIKETNAS